MATGTKPKESKSKSQELSRLTARIEHSRHKLLRVKQDAHGPGAMKEIRGALDQADLQLKMAIHALDQMAGEQARKELRG